MGIDITSKEKSLLIKLIKTHLPSTEVWAYGSRITGKAKSSSDLDLVIFSNASQQFAIANLKEAFEDSNLPFRVDLFVWDEIPDTFKNTIQKKHFTLVKKET